MGPIPSDGLQDTITTIQVPARAHRELLGVLGLRRSPPRQVVKVFQLLARWWNGCVVQAGKPWRANSSRERCDRCRPSLQIRFYYIDVEASHFRLRWRPHRCWGTTCIVTEHYKAAVMEALASR